MAQLLFSLLVITSVILTAQCEDVEEGWINGYQHILPYAVSIQHSPDGSKYDHVCTGSIIKKNYILTSASCFDKLSDDGKLAVNVGVKEHHDEKGQFVNVQKLVLHPSYNKEDPLKKFDIAVLELADSIKFKREARNINLPSKDLVAEGKGELVGWNGLTSKTQKTVTDKVYIASVSVLPSDDCKKSYPDLTDDQFCVGGVNTPDAPCKGTPGIPFGQPIRGFTITGLASSWPETCDGPALFTKVTPFLDFIQEAITN
ncbi:chymotrypsin-like elastase family member 1 [Chrysoperla carnea]|uniref:chymotrypsin-like elastase family member 1 n=1 Tax=Chrysoperla carnea TaxID=189513 RepID=UPI001D063D78|nr:chymotrypsin-like elastase family member 1 [Chrysoperla carnea]